MRFNHLNVPDQWRNYWTKYPNGYTILESLMDWVAQVDVLTDNINEWNEFLNDFKATFEFELQVEVEKTLTEWQTNGFLEVIISNALNTEIDVVKSQLAGKASQSELNRVSDNLLLKASQSELNRVSDNLLLKADTLYVDAGINSLNSKVNSLSSASPKGVYSTLTALNSAFPSGNSNIYLVSENGNWYYWSEGMWKAGGVYQSSGIPEKSIQMTQLNASTLFKNMFDKTAVTYGVYLDFSTGEPATVAGYTASDFIPIVPGQTYTKNIEDQFAFYNSEKQYISGFTNGIYTFVAPSNAYFARFTVPIVNLNFFQIEKGGKKTNNSEFQYVMGVTAIPRKDNTYTLANVGGNFDSLTGGINYLIGLELIAPVTIEVYPNVYEEIVSQLKGVKNIALVGTNKRDCILIDKSGDYYKCPLQIAGNAYIKNMSFIANHDNATVLPEFLSYAMHSDFNYPGTLVFEDCYFESQQNAAVGIGMFSNQTIIFRNCQFYKDSVYDGGCFYVHSAVEDNSVNQKMILINCEIISEQGSALKIDDANIGSGNGLGTDMEITFINCMIYSKTLGKNCIHVNTPPIGADTIAGNVKISPMSYGNNLDILNVG